MNLEQYKELIKNRDVNKEFMINKEVPSVLGYIWVKVEGKRVEHDVLDLFVWFDEDGDLAVTESLSGGLISASPYVELAIEKAHNTINENGIDETLRRIETCITRPSGLSPAFRPKEKEVSNG